ERDVTMVLRECPEPAAATDHVIEASEQRMLAMMRRWFLEGPPETDEDGLRQLVESARRENRARHDRTYAIPAADGTLAAIAKLRREGALAQVEDVFTAPE